MGIIGRQAMAAAAAEKRRAEAKLEKARKHDGSHAVEIVERFLSDEFSDYLVLTELGNRYGATNVAKALRAELQAAREFCRKAAEAQAERQAIAKSILDAGARNIAEAYAEEG